MRKDAVILHLMFCGAGVSVVPDYCHQTGLNRSSLPPTNKALVLQTLNLELDFSKLHKYYDCLPIPLALVLIKSTHIT